MSKIKQATDGMLFAAGLVVFGWVMLSVSFGLMFGPALAFIMLGLPSIVIGIVGYEIERRGL